PDRTTLVVNAKLVTDLDLTAALRTHQTQSALVTMVLRSNIRREAFTTVRVENQRVSGFGPSRVPEGPRPLLFTGLHFLEPEILRRAEARLSDTVRDLYPSAIAAGRVAAHVDDDGRWLEASTLARYLELHIAEARAGHPLPDDVQVEEAATVDASVLGRGVVIEGGATVSESVLLDGCRVGAGARLHGVVVAEGVSIPAQLELQGVVVVPQDLAIPLPAENAPPVTLEGALALARIEGRVSSS
ncbi:MAG: NDP-sugar synthase, partial [Myxococcota bacterium]